MSDDINGFIDIMRAVGFRVIVFDENGPKVIDPPPYPFCRHPEKCRNGRCESDPVCND